MLNIRTNLRQKAVLIAAVVALPSLAVFGVIQYQIADYKASQEALLSNVYQWSDAVDLAHQNAHQTTLAASAFKNSIMRADQTDDFKKYRAEIGESGKKFEANLQAILSNPVIQQDSALVTRLTAWGEGMKTLAVQYEAAADAFASSNYSVQAADALVRGEDKLLNKQVSEFEAAFLKARAESKRLLKANSEARLSALLTEFLIAMGIATLLAGGLAWLVMQSIRKQLGAEPEALAEKVNKMAFGDFRLSAGEGASAAVEGTSVLARLFLMQRQLGQLVRSISEQAAQVKAGVKQIEENLTRVEGASSKQAHTSSGMAAGIEELSASIGQISDATADSAAAAKATSEASGRGAVVMKSTSESIRQTAEGASALGEKIGQLGKQSESISRIIQVIEEIAEQTNLLALNAAIEAARAGEQGRGFAVVADEVRQLAERTTKSTTEIEEMVSAIQKGTHAAVGEMGKWTELSSTNLTRISEAEALMQDMQTQASKVMSMVEEVEAAMVEQKAATGQFSHQVDTVVVGCDETSVYVANVKESINKLVGGVDRLETEAQHFKL